MILTLIKQERIHSITLPNKIKGQYWVTDHDAGGRRRELIGVEADNGVWVLKSNRLASILDAEDKPVRSVRIAAMGFYPLRISGYDEKALIYAEEILPSRQIYRKYRVDCGTELSIGRSADQSILFNNKYVSSRHAVLSRSVRGWSITDCRSTNGTFVNGRTVDMQDLEPGDVVYIMGLSIIIAKDAIAMNDPDSSIVLDEKKMRPVPIPVPAGLDDDKEDVTLSEGADGSDGPEYFYRSPRFKRDIRKAEIRIDPPPAEQKAEEVPLALLIGPSVTMGMAAVVMLLFTISNVMQGVGSAATAAPTAVMSFSMLLGTVLWPILTKRYEKRLRIRNEAKRQQKYLAYLEEVRQTIDRACSLQSEIRNENHGDLTAYGPRAFTRSRDLWERSAGQNDFLVLRLGCGNSPLFADIRFPERHFSMEDDALQQALYQLAESPKQLIGVPVTIDLTRDFICGIIGDRRMTTRFVRQLLLQLVILHSYDEVRTVFLIDRSDYPDWEFARWLPHAWSDDRKIRFVATDRNDVKELSVFMEREMAARINGSEGREVAARPPYYVVFSLSKRLAEKAEMIGPLLRSRKYAGFSLISVCEELKDLPKECSTVIDISEDESHIFDKNDLSGDRLSFRADLEDIPDMERYATALANIPLDLSSQRYSLPGVLTFLEMYGVGKIEHLNALTRWSENDPTLSLQAPVGVDTRGGLFQLDLHERYHGPHGLVAGMTGSGKSEFIITYILSLAVNYHPDEVAFILIDYKGGGLAGAFEDPDKGIKLPHLAGTITNLDGAAVKRSLISIQSELRRRQAIFQEARRTANEGTMDIYKYQKMHRDGLASEPLPHLFIISDEFAELKKQQPDFMEQLISAARIGRSLGIHLILATQKPSGVVDDQIWSNSRFRVCLKVQEKSDSMDMIKRPDAAEIAATGRFFLQVGFNELFEMGQSAWCGAEYVPSDKFQKKYDNSIAVIDTLGRVVKEIRPKVDTGLVKSDQKQIVSIVKYLSDLARDEDIRVKPLWLRPIPSIVREEELRSKYRYRPSEGHLEPIIGEYDDPFNQKQALLTLPLSMEGNAIIYGSTGSGKEGLLGVLIYSLLKDHDANNLTLYLLDFGAETLRAFDQAPQVGDVLLSYESEKIVNLFRMLQKEMEKRKRVFSEHGGDYTGYRTATGKAIPGIVVVINNFSAFSEMFENLEDSLISLTRDGMKCGIWFVLTASASNTVRYRISQNFRQMIALQMNDPTEYSAVIGNTDGVYPSRINGRGIVRLDRVYEFQSASVTADKQPMDFLRLFCADLASTASAYAKKVPILPDAVDPDFLKPYITSLKAVPVGVDKATLAVCSMDLSATFIHLVLANEPERFTHVARAFAGILPELARTIYIDVTQPHFGKETIGDIEGAEDPESMIREIFHEIARRNNDYKDAQMDPGVLATFAPTVCILVGFKALNERLTEDGKDKLRTMLEKGLSIYRFHFLLCDTGANMSSLSYEEWFKRHNPSSDGLWVGDGITDQYTLKIRRITSELYTDVEDGFGYVVKKGKAQLVKLITTGDAASKEETDE
jgi:DNA segregation ATPase FtsK/SpoIIIE, S-DNA-T family